MLAKFTRQPASGEYIAARLTKIDPRGSSELPHEALSATVGGPLAVRPATLTEETGGKLEHKFELMSPVFQGRASLTADESRRLCAGQLVTVSFRTEEETIAMRIYRGVEHCVRRILHASHPA